MAGNAASTDKAVGIVTGGVLGIGAATARLLGEKGMVVALVGRREEKLTEVAVDIEAAGGEAMVLPADLAKASAPGEVVDRVLSRFGRIDVLINNAAGVVAKPFYQFTLAALHEQVATHIRRGFFLFHSAPPPFPPPPRPPHDS